MEEIYRLRDIAKQAGNPILRDKSFELLMQIVKQRKPKSVLEIGVNVGLTGIAILKNSKNAKLTGIEINEEIIREAKANYKKFGVENRAKIFQGDCSEIIPLLTGEYDLIFLDGPKGHYFEYLPHLLSVLKKGGILFADNILFRGYVSGKVKTPHRYQTVKHSLENFINSITNNENLKTKIYDLEDGVSVTEKIK